MDKENKNPCEKMPEETVEKPEKEVETDAKPPETEVKGSDELAKLTDEKMKLASALAETEDKYRRMLAEYDNFRKRSARERDGIYSDAALTIVATMLPVLDNLERALAVETQDEAFKKGVEMTAKQFYDCLEKLQVTEIPAQGEQFDPEKHNAVMHAEQEGVDDNTIVEVFQKGFSMNGKVVRHAMVKVVN